MAQPHAFSRMREKAGICLQFVAGWMKTLLVQVTLLTTCPPVHEVRSRCHASRCSGYVISQEEPCPEGMLISVQISFLPNCLQVPINTVTFFCYCPKPRLQRANIINKHRDMVQAPGIILSDKCTNRISTPTTPHSLQS
jgi:hypothetical protein